MSTRRIGIAMTTYNGESYLEEQLKSFCLQTRPPDELVVCDDGSTDSTLDILRDFAASAAFEVRLCRNVRRLGYADNFGHALAKSEADIILLSDQDDVWLPNKIEVVEKYFELHLDKYVLVNNAEIADGSLGRTGLTVAGQLLSAGFTSAQLLLGCCISFRRELKPLILPVPSALHGHDGWINTLGLTLGCRGFTSEVLQLYRRHGSNTSEWVTTKTTRATRWDVAKQYLSLNAITSDPILACDRRIAELRTLAGRVQRYAPYIGEHLRCRVDVDACLADIEDQCETNEQRRRIVQLRHWVRVPSAARFYLQGGYSRFDGWKSFARDLLYLGRRRVDSSSSVIVKESANAGEP